MVDVEESLGEDSGLVSVQGRQGNVSFRPYRDIKTKVVQQQQAEGEEEGERDTTVDNLYPELLCHIFSHLDTASKGSTAQVRSLSLTQNTYKILLNPFNLIFLLVMSGAFYHYKSSAITCKLDI